MQTPRPAHSIDHSLRYDPSVLLSVLMRYGNGALASVTLIAKPVVRIEIPGAKKHGQFCLVRSAGT